MKAAHELHITYDGIAENRVPRLAAQFRFLAKLVGDFAAPEQVVLFIVNLPSSLLVGEGDQAALQFLPAAANKVVTFLRAVGLPEATTLLDIAPEDVADFKDRRCIFQEEGPAGLFCRAASQADAWGGKTSSAMCRQCELPDDRTRCSLLVHPETLTVHESKQGRSIRNAMCESGLGSGVHWRLCQAGRIQCWKKIVRLPSLLGSLEAGLEDKVCDEVDHWNLAFKSIHGRRPVQPAQLRTVKELVLPCTDEPSFKAKIQALADLIDKIDVKILLQTQPAEGGTLNELAAFCKEQGYDCAEAINILRAIRNVRHDFPAHSGNERVIGALAKLGIKYPVTDWESDWRSILRSFAGAIRALRIALPADKP
jgi:hypothetical protein